ncbi:hypothetical protein [Caballeronia sordidicola]|jgi:hypothetical protein|uniref:hypothetical protein n=1 Tax=Caballeronia sordidicola TaxID=196367 RepID=UPI00126A4C54|nr:hypothetical protein [Caballeronia sordidicola]
MNSADSNRPLSASEHALGTLLRRRQLSYFGWTLSVTQRQELLVVHPPGLVAAAVLYLRKEPGLIQLPEALGARIGWPKHSLELRHKLGKQLVAEVRLHLVVPSPAPAPAK